MLTLREVDLRGSCFQANLWVAKKVDFFGCPKGRSQKVDFFGMPPADRISKGRLFWDAPADWISKGRPFEEDHGEARGGMVWHEFALMI